MLIFGFLLLPIVLAAPAELTQNIYVPKIENGVLKSTEVTGEPPEKLDLSGLGIEFIDVNVFQNLTHVKSINLANNSIFSLDPSTFSNLRELEELSLADNAMSSLIFGLFSELSNLKFLNISNNPIETLPYGSLYGLGKSTNISAKLPHGLSQMSTAVFENRTKTDYEIYVCGANPISPSYDGEYILCIHDGIVKKVKHVYLHNITKQPDCKAVQSEFLTSNLVNINLKNVGISRFASGWGDFNTTSYLIQLDISDNNITDLTAEILNDLSHNVNIVSLSNNKIELIKKRTVMNKYVDGLILSNNYIREIEDGALDAVTLSVLDLSKNRLNNMRFLTTVQPTLEFLDLSDNCINELLLANFTRLHGMVSMNFSGNNITVIRRQSLSGFNSLKWLFLARNKIENIEIGAFRNLKNLSKLDLSNNKLTTFNKEMISDIPTLHHLDLSSNNIKQIVGNCFNGLDLNTDGRYWSSYYIALEVEKKTRDTKQGTMCPGTFLDELYLQNNSLNHLNGDEFTGFDSLGILDLSNNGIMNIKKGFAKHLLNVKKLILSDNPIKRLENGALFGFRTKFDGTIILNNVQLELLQGGVFDDL